jgi:hypothetical protein
MALSVLQVILLHVALSAAVYKGNEYIYLNSLLLELLIYKYQHLKLMEK